MKPLSLIRTTALTSLVALSPVMLIGGAEAGVKIKIKPQTHVDVNVKPRVKVAPKVKVKAAKVRIKTKPKATKQVATDPTSKNQTTTQTAGNNPTVQPAKKVKKTVVTASLTPQSIAAIPVPTERPDREFDSGSVQLDELGQARAAAEAARILDEMEQLASLGGLRDAASVSLDLADVGLSQDPELSNSERLGAPTTGERGGMFGDDRGPGADEFASIDNTHARGPANSGHRGTASAAKDYLGVNRSIEEGMGNLAGGMDMDEDSGGPEYTDWDGNATDQPGGRYHWGHSNDSEVPGRHGQRIYSFEDYTAATKTVVIVDREGATIETTTVDGGRVANRSVLNDDGEYTVVESDLQEPPATSVDELRDPDSGYGGSSPLPWINEREKPTTDISAAAGGKTPGALPQDPYADQVEQGNVQASITQADLLETWDQSSHDRGETTPIDPDGVNQY